MAATWQDHLKNYFKGDTNAYADAIKKGEAGNSLSDPAAAEAFKQANPTLFNAPQPSYQDHLTKFFGGNAEQYANTIIGKEARGETLSDPDAASAFKNDYSNLFPQPKPATEEDNSVKVPPAGGVTNTGGGNQGVPSQYIPLSGWFGNQGQNLNFDQATGNIATSGGFNFPKGSYTEQDGNYYVDPVALAGMYLGKPQQKLTPEIFSQYTEVADKMYEPVRTQKANALKEALGERAAATRRSAIHRGTYTSGVYDANKQTNVEEPYAKELSNLEGYIAAMVNNAAMQQYGQDRSAEQGQMTNIVNYLLGLDNTQYNRQQDATQNAIQLIPSFLNG